MLNLFKRKKNKATLSYEVIESDRDKYFCIELPDGLRLIFCDGVYSGHYDPALNEVLEK